MPIFVAKDYEGYTESVVLAENEKLAHAYWQGTDVTACSVDRFSEQALSNHPTGVLPIVKTKVKQVYNLKDNSKVRVILKG